MILFENCTVFDGHSSELIEGATVVIENDRIKEITDKPVVSSSAWRIDCKGRILMPGLIDAHVHAYTPSFNFYGNDRMPSSLMANHAAVILTGMLQRGFTSVRDAAGGDRGLWMAIEQGLIKGPRFFYPGKAISQTGGHGDMRSVDMVEPCGCAGASYSGAISVTADGPDEVRKAVREQLRTGAHHIKIFASGGVSSPSDPIWMNQFSEDEIRAAVEEANVRRTYVMAHCHTDAAVRRCVEYGVRTIEHGSNIGSETASLMAEKGAFMVPTLAVIDVVRTHGPELGLPPTGVEKIKGLYEDSLRSIEVCSKAGVKIGLGSDLLDHKYHGLQGGELRRRGAVSSPIEVLRSATSINAEILQKQGELGCIKVGALADILLLNFDPFKDLSGFETPGKNLAVIMRDGKIVKNQLTSSCNWA